MVFMLEALWRIPGSRYKVHLFLRTVQVLDSPILFLCVQEQNVKGATPSFWRLMFGSSSIYII